MDGGDNEVCVGRAPAFASRAATASHLLCHDRDHALHRPASPPVERSGRRAGVTRIGVMQAPADAGADDRSLVPPGPVKRVLFLEGFCGMGWCVRGRPLAWMLAERVSGRGVSVRVVGGVVRGRPGLLWCSARCGSGSAT